MLSHEVTPLCVCVCVCVCVLYRLGRTTGVHRETINRYIHHTMSALIDGMRDEIQELTPADAEAAVLQSSTGSYPKHSGVFELFCN